MRTTLARVLRPNMINLYKKGCHVMAGHEEFVKKIEKVSRSDETRSEVFEMDSQERVAPNKELFDTLVNTDVKEEKKISIETTDNSPKNSIFDEVRNMNYKERDTKHFSSDSLASQTRDLVAQIDDVKKTLSSPDLSLKNSTKQLLENKLTHIDENLKIALSKAGLEYEPTAAVSTPNSAEGRINPIDRFLGFLTDGQSQLQNLGHELAAMSSKKQQLGATDMLAIQVKMGQIQQEIELFTSLLSKSLDSIKTLMNVQV